MRLLIRWALWTIIVVVVLIGLFALWQWQANRTPEAAETGTLIAGTVDEIEDQSVVYVAEQGIYVVSTEEGVLALDDDSRHVGDRVLYCSVDDTFFSPAHGERFDGRGRYLSGPAQGDMVNFPVTVVSGEVFVDVSGDPEPPPRSELAPVSHQGPTCSGDGTEDPPGFWAADED
jgi:nitrite reductase/ring-hydroxylating ferredoxin subunit